MAGQTITLQFGTTADRLGNHFWNAQDALLRWAEYKGKQVDTSQYFATVNGQPCPRLVSLLPVESKEVVGELSMADEQDKLEHMQLQTAASPRELFPHIIVNKKSVQRSNIDVRGDMEPFYEGMQHKWDSEDFMDSIRYFAEECDHLSVIQTFTSDDQYGGYGASLMEPVIDDYPKKTMTVFSVPSVDLKSSWESKALSLFAYSSTNHIPFALMKPDDLEWSVKSYEPFPIFASAIDTINSNGTLSALPLHTVGSIAYGMRMECDASGGRVEPVIDLMSFASPLFHSIVSTVERAIVPSYVKMNDHGYIAHHTIAAFGVPRDFPDYLEDICEFINKSNAIRRVDRDLHVDIQSFLLNLADN